MSNTDNKDSHEISCFSVSGDYIGSIPVKERASGVAFDEETCSLVVLRQHGWAVYSKVE